MKFITYLLYICILALMGYMTFLSYGFMKSRPVPDTGKDETIQSIQQAVPKKPEGKRPYRDEATSSWVITKSVPFTSQAPFGNWGELVHQEGCEEASILMAHAWATASSITPDEADRIIEDISEYEKRTLGTFIHTSLSDTAKTLRDYFSFNDFEVMENVTRDDIIYEIRQGNLVIVPASGRELKNRFFTPPGPVSHMLVIVGYDEGKKEFITNDPGTKNGDSYRYGEDILYGAIWDYPTSSVDSVVPEHKDKKPMLVVRKER